MNVLVVEDDKFQRDKYVQMLRDEGYTVVGAPGVDSAIGAARSSSLTSRLSMSYYRQGKHSAILKHKVDTRQELL